MYEFCPLLVLIGSMATKTLSLQFSSEAITVMKLKLQKKKKKCSLSSPLPNMNSVEVVEFDWLPLQPNTVKKKEAVRRVKLKY